MFILDGANISLTFLISSSVNWFLAVLSEVFSNLSWEAVTLVISVMSASTDRTSVFFNILVTFLLKKLWVLGAGCIVPIKLIVISPLVAVHKYPSAAGVLSPQPIKLPSVKTPSNKVANGFISFLVIFMLDSPYNQIDKLIIPIIYK